MLGNTIDSFEILLQQVEKDVISLVSDVKDVLALFGAYYVSKKMCKFTLNVIDAINVHFVCQFISINEKKWRRQYGPWAGNKSFKLILCVV